MKTPTVSPKAPQKMPESTRVTPTVTLIPGDGIGPEVVGAAQRLIKAAGVDVDWDVQTAGREVFESGSRTGVPQETFESIQRNRVALKGPLETPIGHGGKSANVTLRKMFECYANTRPARIYPGIVTPFSDRDIDIMVVRENVEDLYAGIEYMITPGVAECLKVVSAKGCEKIVQLAFELARSQGRKKITCVTKANIMKLSEGLLKRTFERISEDFPEIETEQMLVDNAAHQLVRRPETFDVMVMTNMNGDILSDLVSGLVGGLGLAPGANLGRHAAIFEAVHGTAPDIAGKDLANPTATMLSSVMMLRHLGFYAEANAIEAAVALTLQTGPRTGDICGDQEPVGTTAFTDAVIANLGNKPEGWTERDHRPLELAEIDSNPVFVETKSRRVLGADLFVESGMSPADLGRNLETLAGGTDLRLKIISNRGQVVYPVSGAPTDCIDSYRCRFLAKRAESQIDDLKVLELSSKVARHHELGQMVMLYEFDKERGYSLAQGEE